MGNDDFASQTVVYRMNASGKSFRDKWNSEKSMKIPSEDTKRSEKSQIELTCVANDDVLEEVSVRHDDLRV